MAETRINFVLKIDGQGRATASWNNGYGSYPEYRLVTGLIQEKIDSARRVLETLTDAYPHPIPDDHPILADLARYGHALRNALFEDCEPADTALAEDARKAFDELVNESELVNDSLTITVNTDVRLSVPWGILHERGDDVSAGQRYAHFWAPRFNVAASYGSRILPRARVPGGAKLLAGKHEQIFAETLPLLDPGRRARVERILQHPVGCANTVAGCRKMWNSVGDHDCIIYFFGHANGRELLFNDRDDGKLSVSGFRSTFRRDSRTERGRASVLKTLTILNGCLSGTGQDANSFALATTLPGFYGFIGAEARIPNTFGLIFGSELLEFLLDHGMTVGEAVAALRECHKPYGLLYGSYADPNFATAPYAA